MHRQFQVLSGRLRHGGLAVPVSLETAAILEASGLCKAFGRHRAVDDVTLALRPGITALLGPNGAGKTTLIKLLTGVLRPDGGTVRYAGTKILGRRRQQYLRHLGYLPQKPTWHGWMEVRDVVAHVAWMRRVPV